MEEPATSCLSPQEPDLGKGGRIEEVLESRPQPGVPWVTPRTDTHHQASSGENVGWNLGAGSDQSPCPLSNWSH